MSGGVCTLKISRIYLFTDALKTHILITHVLHKSFFKLSELLGVSDADHRWRSFSISYKHDLLETVSKGRPRCSSSNFLGDFVTLGFSLCFSKGHPIPEESQKNCHQSLLNFHTTSLTFSEQLPRKSEELPS